MPDRPTWDLRLRRLAAAAVAWTSVAVEYHGLPGEYFAYFTILTNLAIGTWFLWGVLNPDRAARAGALRLALTVYGLVTVAVYWIFLSPTHHPHGLSFFANLGLHVVAPLAMAAEGLGAPWPPVKTAAVFWTLVFPGLYCAFSLIRGELTGWYPYFFLNKTELGGWLPLAGFVVFLLAVFLGAGFGWRALVALRHPSERAKTAAE